MGRSTVYNDIVTDELWEQVNPDNKELLEEFIEYLHSTDKSELTIINYKSDIQICFVWALKHNKNKFFVDFTKRDIMKYQNWLINTLSLSPSRVRRLRSAISSMSNFIENILDEDYPNFRNIVNKIPAPVNQPVREKTVLEDEDIDKLLNILVEKKQYQQACCLALAVSSGARKSELTRFKVHYFNEDNIKLGAWYKTPEKIRTKGRGKQGKPLYRWVLVKKFKPYLDLWLQEREKLGIDNEYLFVVKKKDGWKRAKISTLDSWAEQFNKYLDKHFYWHCNRHYFTTMLCKYNIPAQVVQKLIGWETVDMVSVYNDTDIDDELSKYFDESGIKQVKQKSLADL